MDLQSRSQTYQLATLLLISSYIIAFFLSTLDHQPGYVWFVLGGLCCWMPIYSSIAMMSDSGSGHPQEWLFLFSLLAWWANPCWWVGLVLVLNRRWFGAVIAGGAATMLALWFLLMTKSETLGPGYWLWLASMVGLWLVALAGKAEERKMLRSLAWEEPEECYPGPIEMIDERIHRMEPADAIHRPSRPGL